MLKGDGGAMASARRGRGAEGGGWRQKKKVKHTPFLEGCGQWEGGPQIRPLGSNFRKYSEAPPLCTGSSTQIEVLPSPQLSPGIRGGSGLDTTPHPLEPPLPAGTCSLAPHRVWVLQVGPVLRVLRGVPRARWGRAACAGGTGAGCGFGGNLDGQKPGPLEGQPTDRLGRYELYKEAVFILAILLKSHRLEGSGRAW